MKGKLFLATILIGLLTGTLIAKERKYAVVKVEAANVRIQPSSSSPIIYVAKFGEKLEIMDKIRSWYKIITPQGKEGFIWEKLVKVEIATEEVKSIAEKKEPVSVQKVRHERISSKASKVSVFYLGGGLSYLSGGELNKGLKGWNDLISRVAISVSGEMQPLTAGLNLYAGYSHYLSESFAFTISSSYIFISKKPFISYEYLPNTFADWNNEISISLIPVLAGIKFDLFSSSNMKFFAKGAAGILFWKFYWHSREKFPNTLTNITFKAKKLIPAFEGGFGMEMALSESFGLFFEFTGRYGKLSEIKGEEELEEEDFINRIREYYEEAYLWFLEITDGETYWFLIPSPSRPVFSDTTARKASINLSGFNINLGLSVKF